MSHTLTDKRNHRGRVLSSGDLLCVSYFDRQEKSQRKREQFVHEEEKKNYDAFQKWNVSDGMEWKMGLFSGNLIIK